MDSGLDYHTARALLEWQVELGVTETIGETPLNRYDLPDKQKKVTPGPGPTAVPQAVKPKKDEDPVEIARISASAARTLEDLKTALAGYDLCDLKKGARNLVFADGVPGSRVMIIGEAPGREEDQQGRPFVGRAGHLLDRMLEAIGLSRAENVYITNVLPWRPPQNRDPKPDEIAMMKPFLERHVALAKPDVLVLMGNISCQTVLGRRGITRMRGKWDQAWDLPVMPMLHPAYLLRQPQAKRETWADLLDLNAHLREKT